MTSAGDPEYTTHAVAERTGIPAETFLAWERRHGIPKPFRTANQERLYSQQDIDDIIWLRTRTNDGIPIRHAVTQLKALASRTQAASQDSASSADVVVSMTATSEIAASPSTATTSATEQSVVANIVNALTHFDERGASAILVEFAAVSVSSLLIGTIIPEVLSSLETRVNSGEASPAVDRLGRLFLSRKLGALLDVINLDKAGPSTIVVGVSAETREIDVLIEAIRIARTGRRVLLLGTDISLFDLVTVASSTDPQQIALVASNANAARQVGMFQEHLRLHFPHEVQIQLLGIGPAFPPTSERTADTSGNRKSKFNLERRVPGDSQGTPTDR